MRLHRNKIPTPSAIIYTHSRLHLGLCFYLCYAQIQTKLRGSNTCPMPPNKKMHPRWRRESKKAYIAKERTSLTLFSWIVRTFVLARLYLRRMCELGFKRV